MTLPTGALPMGRFAIAPTDPDWLSFLSAHSEIKTINFWTPTPWNISGLPVGGRLYFLRKGKSPRKIGGYGSFVRYVNQTARDAWGDFGIGNGVASAEALLKRLESFASKRGSDTPQPDEPEIGCIVLSAPVYFAEPDQFTPEEMGAVFPNAIVKIKYFSAQDTNANRLSTASATGRSGLVTTADDIRRNVLTFGAEAMQAGEAVKKILTSTSYWIYDPRSDAFAPSKFGGLRDITIHQYLELQREVLAKGSVAGFDGATSAAAIAETLHTAFTPSQALSGSLRDWGTAVMGSDPFDGVNTARWSFVTLPNVSTDTPSTRIRNTIPKDEAAYQHALEVASASGAFTPPSEADAKEKVMAAITRRRGQPAFRRTLLAAYGGKCAITGCDVQEALEAAHLIPYNGEKTNHPANGVLLRADIHTLFDLGLISIHPRALSVSVAYSLKHTAYGNLHGKAISKPVEPALQPHEVCLARHYLASGFVL